MIIYLVNSTLLLGLLFGMYKLLLENEKMHHFNRFFLLLTLVFGLTAPLISFELSSESSISGVRMQQIDRVVNAPAEAVNRSVEPLITPKQGALSTNDLAPGVGEQPSWSISTLDVMLWLYGAITIFLLIRFVVGLNEIKNKIKTGTHKKLEHATLVLIDEPITPQSFLDYIFLEKQQFESSKIEPEILNHEFTHVRQFHSFDVLLIEFLKVIFWFNPLLYLYKHAIQLNHEFQADEAVVRSGSSVSDYQEMLIRVSAGNTSLKVTSSINFSLTKKRIIMMGKSISKVKVGAVWLFLLPLSVALIIVFSAQKERYPQTISMQEIWDSLPPTTYFDVDLESDGLTGLYHPLDERTGILIGPEGEPYTGERNTFSADTDSLLYTETIVDGIVVQTAHSLHDSTGTPYKWITIPSIDAEGNEVATYYSDRLTDSLVLSLEIISGSELQTHNFYYPSGQLKISASYSWDPTDKESLKHGLMTEYDKKGNITMQERYKDGELIEKIK